MAWPGDTFGGMQAVRRLAGGDPGIIADAGLGIAAAGLIAVAVLGPPGLIGSDPIAGPSWLLALLPLLLGVPLVLRRRAPLLMWRRSGRPLRCCPCSPWAGHRIAAPEFGLYPRTPASFTFVLFAAAYSLGAHASLRRAAAGLILAAPVVAEISHMAGWRWPSHRVATLRPWHCRCCSSWRSGWLAFSSAPAGRPPGWPRGARRCSARPSRPRRPSGHGSPGNCTTSSPTTSAWSCCTPPGRGPLAGRTQDPGGNRAQRAAGPDRDPPPVRRAARPRTRRPAAPRSRASASCRRWPAAARRGPGGEPVHRR